MTFKVGDRVICFKTPPYNHRLEGLTGTVVVAWQSKAELEADQGYALVGNNWATFPMVRVKFDHDPDNKDRGDRGDKLFGGTNEHRPEDYLLHVDPPGPPDPDEIQQATARLQKIYGRMR